MVQKLHQMVLQKFYLYCLFQEFLLYTSFGLNQLTTCCIWQHLLNEITRNCYTIATDKSGCCVLQSCVENAYGEPKQNLIKEIIRNALQLAEDPYGFDPKSSSMLFFYSSCKAILISTCFLNMLLPYVGIMWFNTCWD